MERFPFLKIITSRHALAEYFFFSKRLRCLDISYIYYHQKVINIRFRLSLEE